MDIIKQIALDLNLDQTVVLNTVNLLDEGNSVPFIARYRKDVTNSLEDKDIRNLEDRLHYLRNLEDRKKTVIDTITSLGKMTEELNKSIQDCLVLSQLEDIYRPYKPKKQTKGQIAIKLGLKPLSEYIRNDLTGNLNSEAKKYIDVEKGIEDENKAIQMACNIIAEEIADSTKYRVVLKENIDKYGRLVAKLTKNKTSDVYDFYDNFSKNINYLKPHQILAIFRGEKQKCLNYDIEYEDEWFFKYVYNREAKRNTPYEDLFKEIIKDSYSRLVRPSVLNDIYSTLFEKAEDSSIKTFDINLEHLLMQPPLKKSVVMGFDPGFVNGCKIAIVDELSNVLYTGKTYVTVNKNEESLEKGKRYIADLIQKYSVKFIALGNGTASRESEKFLKNVLKGFPSCRLVIVSESGASIYSASKLGIEEFPDFDVAVRSAVSIARRLIDPLSELVKIDPESIGVGQYQHDINQTKLKEALHGVVEDCVNKVGVDINYASKSILSYISGITPSLADNIVKYRSEVGKFNSRNDFLNVKKFGPKAFLNAAGFLRIKDGNNFLDATSIHPESYKIAKYILNKYNINSLSEAKTKLEKVSSKEIEQLANQTSSSLTTINDIVNDLLKPGLDPRSEIKFASLNENITDIKDLKVGMVLEGTIRNVSDFGCFVDIGLHQDGLVHISEISNKKIQDINEVIAIGDIIKVKVIGIDIKRNRVSLSIKQV